MHDITVLPYKTLKSIAQLVKKLLEKSRERHNDKPHPIPDTKRKRKMTEIDAGKINKHMHKKHIDQLSVSLLQARWSQR